MQYFGDRTPGLSAWAPLMPVLLPEHVWLPIEDTTAEVDLDVLIVGSGPLGSIPEAPALVVPSSLGAYHEWMRNRRESLGFLCLSPFTAHVIRQEQAAPCTFLPWNATFLAGTVGQSLDVNAPTVGARWPPSALWFFLPAGDAPSARLITWWLAQQNSSSGVPVVVVGPMSADASNLLGRASSQDRLIVMNRPTDALVLAGIGSARAAVIIDLCPSAEITGYLGAIMSQDCPLLVIAGGAYADIRLADSVTVLPASTAAPACASAIASLVSGDPKPGLGQPDPVNVGRLASEALSAGISTAIDLAMSYRPIQEAIQSVRSCLHRRGLLDEETAAVAAESFAWMLHKQPWAEYDQRA